MLVRFIDFGMHERARSVEPPVADQADAGAVEQELVAELLLVVDDLRRSA